MNENDSDVSARLQLAISVVAETSKLIMKYYRTDLEVESKQDLSPVTVADREAELLLRERISQQYPHDGLVGEEFGENPGSSAYRWILDPIDGTKSFVSGVPLFGTLIGILRDELPVAGLMAFPPLGEVLYAADGAGAWLQIGRGDPRPVRVSQTSALHEAYFMTTQVSDFAARNAANVYRELEATAAVTRTWGDCFGYYLVATGRATIMIDPALNIWDAAPMLPILKEAGGRYTDWHGRESIATGDAVATNGLVHSAVLQLIREQDDSTE